MLLRPIHSVQKKNKQLRCTINSAHTPRGGVSSECDCHSFFCIECCVPSFMLFGQTGYYSGSHSNKFHMKKCRNTALGVWRSGIPSSVVRRPTIVVVVVCVLDASGSVQKCNRATWANSNIELVAACEWITIYTHILTNTWLGCLLNVCQCSGGGNSTANTTTRSA